MKNRPLRFVVRASMGLALTIFCSTLQAADRAKQETGKTTSPPADSPPAVELVEILFHLKIDRQVYIQSDWGQPPQLAVWLERPAEQELKTLWVSHRTGAGQWKGKAGCPVSLPYWVGRYNKETKTTGPPSFRHPAADAITGPTPKAELRITTEVPPGSSWDYFIEVNVSGDFSPAFPSVRDDGVDDRQGNGQPSLIYRGKITAAPGAHSSPKLVGRTAQLEPVDQIIRKLDGITTAKRLLPLIEVSCAAVAD